MEAELGGKRINFCVMVIPGLARVAVLGARNVIRLPVRSWRTCRMGRPALGFNCSRYWSMVRVILKAPLRRWGAGSAQAVIIQPLFGGHNSGIVDRAAQNHIATRRGMSAPVELPGGNSPPGAPKTVCEPLDLHGSRCSTVGRRATGSPRPRALPVARWLQSGPWPRLNNAAPSVQPITEPSSLLRATPPLCSASVLSSSRF